MNTDTEREVASVLDALPERPSAAHRAAVLEAADRSLGRQAPATRRLRPAWFALAAGLVAALALGVLLGTPEQPQVVRAGGDDVVPPARASLDAVPAAFAWPAVPHATGYRFVLRDEAAQVVWTSERLDAPRLALPDAVRATLGAPASYVWSVQVSGPRPQEIGPYWFDLRGR